MQTLHPVLKRGGLIWDREQVPAALFPPRLARVQAAMAAAGHDAWLVYGDALRYGDLAYLSHYLPRVRGTLLVVPREGAPVLLVSGGSRGIPAASELTWIEDVRPLGRLPDDVANLLREWGLDRGRVGLASVEELLDAHDADQIRALLPGVRWEPLPQDSADAGPLARLRAAKDPTELALMRRAAAIVRDGLETAARVLRPGISERALLADVDRQLRYGAAEDARCLIASGPRASVSLRPADDRVLEPGDVVLLHLAAEHQRYWAEGGQTFVLGTADAELRALFDTAAVAVQDMVAVARPGAAANPLLAAALAVLDAQPAPSPEHAALATSYGLGHGIGIDLEEPPYLRPDHNTALVDGAVLALHVVLHGRGGRGALATQTVVVGSDGAQQRLGPIPPLRELPA